MRPAYLLESIHHTSQYLEGMINAYHDLFKPQYPFMMAFLAMYARQYPQEGIPDGMIDYLLNTQKRAFADFRGQKDDDQQLLFEKDHVAFTTNQALGRMIVITYSVRGIKVVLNSQVDSGQHWLEVTIGTDQFHKLPDEAKKFFTETNLTKMSNAQLPE